MSYLGDFPVDHAGVIVPFHTFDSNDPSASVAIAALVVGDIAIYKGTSMVQRSSPAGIALMDTDGIDLDANVGIGGFSVDLSDNTDAGFYAAGNEYYIVVGPVTIDAAVVNFVAATFSIERAGGVLALLKGTNSLANIEDKLDIIDTNVDDIEALAVGATGFAAIDTVVDGIQTDLSNGTDGLGALKTLIDTVNTDLSNGTDGLGALKALIDTIDGIADNILTDTGTTLPATLATIAGYLDTEIAAIKVVTDALPNAGALSSLATAADLATVDTVVDGIQTDLSNGTDGLGALKTLIDTIDTVVDAIKVVTDLLNTAQAEPTGVPAANETPLDKLGIIFMMARNKLTVTSGKKTFHGDDGVAEFEQDLTDNGTTYTQSEVNAI